ncbi:MAG: MFS transporter [Nocardioides sp.]|uniref:MFS transporter n=1 Tax=Nocardioides sp. TaxID=35761 RepID=UPI0039E663D8
MTDVSAPAPMTDVRPAHGPDYEWKIIAILALSIGMMGFDRWLLTSLFPVIGPDLGLNYQDLGNITAAMGVVFGVCAIAAGTLSDTLGRRRIVIPAMIAFSLFSAFSGMVGSLVGLLLMRMALGVSEGSFLPTMYASAMEGSKPSRRGLTMGLLISCFPLFGLGLGPILATRLLDVVPGWRWVFVVSAVPGIILALLIARVMKDRPNYPLPAGERPADHRVTVASVGLLLRERNIVVALLATCLGLGSMFVLGGMMPSYLTDYLGLSLHTAGNVTAAVGFGGFAGQILLSGLSDVIGRRAMLVGTSLTGAAMIAVFTQIGPTPGLLFAVLFLASMCVFALMSLIAGPVTTEAAPAGLLGAASGLVIGGGEIFGAASGTVISGVAAQHFGIDAIPVIGVACMVLAAVAGLFLRETAPRLFDRPHSATTSTAAVVSSTPR